MQQIASTINPGVRDEATSGFDDTIETDESMEDLMSSMADDNIIITDKSVSILVCTGVYTTDSDFVTYGGKEISNHNHRDFVLDNQLKQPTYVTQNVLEAVKLVFELEKFH